MKRELMWGGAIVVAAQAALILSMLIGSAATDPGGVTGIVMILAPVLVTAVLAAVAWLRPGIGAFIAAAAGAIAVIAAFANARVTGLPDWFGGIGHVIVVAGFVVIAAYAMQRPTHGGVMLLVAAALVGLATPDIALFLAGPAALAGILFLGAGRVGTGPHVPQVGPVG